MKIEGDEKGETMPGQEKDVTYDQFVIIIITQRCKDTDVSQRRRAYIMQVCPSLLIETPVCSIVHTLVH